MLCLSPSKGQLAHLGTKGVFSTFKVFAAAPVMLFSSSKYQSKTDRQDIAKLENSFICSEVSALRHVSGAGGVMV